MKKYHQTLEARSNRFLFQNRESGTPKRVFNLNRNVTIGTQEGYQIRPNAE